MQSIQDYRSIYRYTLDALEKGKLSRRELIYAVIDSFELTAAERLDDSMNGRVNVLRSRIGTVINDMVKKQIIAKDKSELYYRVEDRSVAIRIEECEREILSILNSESKTKYQIKDELISYFGTDTTPTLRDDNKLFTFMGQILKRLVGDDILLFDGAKYSIAPEKSAYIRDMQDVLHLKATFLSKIHSKGGEFFEHYFMNLVAKFLAINGKTVIESHVTGGSDDGGIDGIVRTVDALGFREVIMVQTKNRSDHSTETDVRGFYGAVCALQGSRGIFATTSDFHPMARKLLDSIDNCVGVNGDTIFSMAEQTQYGIKKEGERLIIDQGIF